MSKKRVLLIGAGRRIQNNFLPALSCLKDRFEIVGIHSRTPDRLRVVAEKWGVPAVDSLASLDLSSVDVVAISVPTAENANALARVVGSASRLHAVVDTPLAWNGHERAASLPLLNQFARVTITEDYMNFPQFELVRRAVRTGLIGQVRSLTLDTIGYLYHGLALIRSFSGFGPVYGSKTMALGSLGNIVSYSLGDGYEANVIGPYRRHTSGGLVLEGTHGIISEFPVDRDAGNGKPVFILQGVRPGGVLRGFRIDGPGFEMAVDLPEMAAMREMAFADKSDMNLARGCGLIGVFRHVGGDHNINSGYGVQNALYDSFVSTRATRGEHPLDPFETFILPPSRAQEDRRLVAATDTFLKAGPAMASDLSPGEKVAIAVDTPVTADTIAEEGSHLKLTGVRINGAPLSGHAWYVYSPHFAM